MNRKKCLAKIYITAAFLFLFFFNAEAVSLHSSWALDPGFVEILTWTDLNLNPQTQLTLGYLIGGRQGRPQDRQEDLDLLYFKSLTDIGEFTYGKFRPAWEYGPFKSVMLSGNAPGMVGLKYATTLAGMDYEKFTTWLSAERGKLFGHRLEIPLGRYLKVGIKETALFSREFDGFWACYVPLWPFYLTKYIPGTSTAYNNMAIGLDFMVEPTDNIKIYGDLFVTEFPLGPEKRNLPIYAALAAFQVKDLVFKGLEVEGEYLRATNYLYSHRYPETHYEFKGKALGTPLGPDAERLGLLLGYGLTPSFTLYGGLRGERKGEGKLADYYSNVDEGRANLFLSGTVEKRLIPTVGFAYQITPKIYAKLMAEMEFLKNANHVEGEEGTRTAGTLTLRYDF